MPENGLGHDFFHYHLPEERIAQKPLAQRDRSRLLVAGEEGFQHCLFHQMEEILRPNDCLVLNRTKVIPARLRGRRPSGAQVEVFLLEQLEGKRWSVLGKPGRAFRNNSEILFDDGIRARVAEKQLAGGLHTLEFSAGRETLLALGEVPLPPYIRRKPGSADRSRYQTVFAKDPGAVAAPTAGLHFTRALLQRLRKKGVLIAEITLHVGPGTFQPLNGSPPASEAYEVGPEACEAVNRARTAGGRIVAVGTTSVRALETAALNGLPLSPAAGRTELFIRPPFAFRAVDLLVTNFHLPGSTLLLLVAAFAGENSARAAYETALAAGYRFLSYGDAALFSRAKEAHG